MAIDNAKDIQTVDDVADEKTWLRVVFEPNEKGWAAKNLIGDEVIGGFDEIDEGINAIEKLMREKETPKICIHQSQAADDSSSDEADEIEEGVISVKRKSFVAYFVAPKSPERFLRDDDLNSINVGKVPLEIHNADVENYARCLAGRLNLGTDLIDALATAGKWHDVGKNRPCWQRAIGNNDLLKPLAKSGHHRFNNNLNKGYRHEFGSLIEAEADKTLKAHPHRELILHLIATHHGWARPHFPQRAFDPRQPKPFSLKTANYAMKRFINLQNKLGWWQLAYLEAVLKAADAMASRERAGE
ncbi:MAG: hypothetical protein LC778_20355 [Acidobacteria bacterium]|nr:hypothetical protein [Acidobacteriota bacterium]